MSDGSEARGCEGRVAGSVSGDASTGDERGDLLAELRVLEQKGILAALELLLLLLLLLLVVLVLMLVLMLMLMLVLVLLLLRLGLRAFVENADRSVLPDSVGNFRRVYPHG